MTRNKMGLTALAGCLGLLLSGPASAQNLAALCRLMGAGDATPSPVATVQAKDVAYKAGVDVHGKPVAPANINAGMESSADTVEIPLSIDLAKRLHMPRGMKMETDMGTVEVHKDGRVTAGDVDLTAQSRTLCGMPALTPAVKGQAVQAPAVPHVAVPSVPVVKPPVMTDGTGKRSNSGQ